MMLMHAEIRAGDEDSEQRADAGGGQGGEDREGVHEAFVENAEDDVDREQGGSGSGRGFGFERVAAPIWRCRRNRVCTPGGGMPSSAMAACTALARTIAQVPIGTDLSRLKLISELAGMLGLRGVTVSGAVCRS